MAASLAALLQQLTPQQVFQLLLNYYQVAGYPTTAWEQGGPDVARNQAFAQALSDELTNYIPAIAAGSLLDYAPQYPGWTALTAYEIFNLTVNGATSTQGYILATNTSSTAYSFSPSNQLIAVFSDSGKRYFSQGSGTIPAGGSLLILFQAEFPGASYADPSNSANLKLASPSLPGVTLTNPSTNYSSVTKTGSGTGSISLGGSPVGAHSIVLLVTATSAGVPLSVSYELDGGAPVALGIVSSVTNLAGLGINVTFNNGGSGTSWVSGDTFSFSTPAPWIISQGSDTESDAALADRSRSRWSSLSPIPTAFLYQLLAKSTPGVGSQVTQCFTAPDPVVNNKTNVVIAGPGGVLPPAVISTVQAYLIPYARGCDNPLVQSPTTTPVTIAATIYGSASQAAAIDAAARTAYNSYIANISVNGTIKLSAFEVMAVPNPVTAAGGISGVTDIQGLTINGVAANLTLGTPTTYVLPAYPPTLNLTYVLT